MSCEPTEGYERAQDIIGSGSSEGYERTEETTGEGYERALPVEPP